MSRILEYIGLDTLLNGAGIDLGASFLGIIFYIPLLIGMVAWIIVAIFFGSYVDKGATVFNLLVAIINIIFILAIILTKLIKQKDKKELFFLIFFIGLNVITFIYGFNHTYHSLLFNYEYKPLYSGLAMTLYPNMIFYSIYLIINKKKNSGKSPLGPFSYIFTNLCLFFFIFLVGQAITVWFAFKDNKEFFDKFVTYHDIYSYKERKNWECDDYNKCLMDTITTNAKEDVDYWYENNSYDYKKFLDEGNTKIAEERLVSLIHRSNLFGEITDKNYGFDRAGTLWIDDYNCIYKIRDRVYFTYYYYKFNWKTYEVVESNEQEYNTLEKEQKK